MKKRYTTTNLFGLKIFSKDFSSLLNILTLHLKKRDRVLSIFTPNPEQVVLSKKDKSFAKYLGFADILIPDGIGLVFASKILSFFGKSKKIVARITGIDLSRRLLSISKKEKLKVLIIGGRGYLDRKYNGQKVNKYFQERNIAKELDRQPIWWTEGYNQFNSPTDGENNAINSVILSLKPDLVFVAFGAPFQEKWIVENNNLLKKAGVSIVMAVGGTFDVLFGNINRAPEWMQNLGLEWLYRLFKEPWRWHRQLSLLEFVRLVIKEIFILR